MTSTSQRGFAALVPVLLLGSMLVSVAAFASQDAYLMRFSVLHTEHVARAEAAARSCAMSALLRFAQAPESIIRAEKVLLGEGLTCTIEKFEYIDTHYQFTTSAVVGSSSVRLVTRFDLENGTLVRIVLRKI